MIGLAFDSGAKNIATHEMIYSDGKENITFCTHFIQVIFLMAHYRIKLSSVSKS